MQQSGVAAVVWFRDDLRTDDHPALWAAVEEARAKQGAVVALYVLDDRCSGRPLGAASRWWLHHSLQALAADLAGRGIPLLCQAGAADVVMLDLIGRLGQSSPPVVFWTQGQTPFLRAVEHDVALALRQRVYPYRCQRSELLVEPQAIMTGSGKPYRVFTPFYKSLLAAHWPEEPCAPVSAEAFPWPSLPESLASWAIAEELPRWGCLPQAPDWASGFRQAWVPGEAGARQRLETFASSAVATYGGQRDFPAEEGTSRLSPHLRFGEISPRRVWAMLTALQGGDASSFLREVAWREFNHHLLFQAPEMAEQPLRPEFASFPWQEDAEALRRWQKGATGFPIVDAGLRELWVTGWMHNRVRMIVGSFLVKDLLLSWQWGEQWFWETLVDACPANNPGNWQWVAGCGSDAAPYFRVFNPEMQAKKFDPESLYQRRWIPEAFGGRYVSPIVNHHQARDRALQAFASVRKD